MSKQLIQAKIQLRSNYGRLKLCSPYIREDLAAFLEENDLELNDKDQDLDVIASIPDFSHIWGLRTDPIALEICTEKFIISQLPFIIEGTKLLVAQWPQPNDPDFPYLEQIKELETYI
jgi:hypothetical protein